MSVLDLRDAYHTLPLSKGSQKYCGITPYYGCPTYVYLCMGMGMSCSPALWQQFVHIIWEELPNKERYKIIMDDILIFSTKEQHWEDLDNLFKELIKYGLKISPHKCQLFKRELVYMGLQFIVKDGVPHYTAMKDKCDTIHNMQTPKSVKECRTFCGMVNFLSTFCKNLRELLIPIYELMKKRARYQWTDKRQKAFEDIKKLLVKPPILRKPRQLSGFELPKLNTIDPEYREFFTLLMNKAKMYRDMDLEWHTLQALELRNKSAMLTNMETFSKNDIVYLLAPHASALQSNAQKFRQDYVGPLVIDTKVDETHYLLKDITGHTLKGDYHINCIKKAGKITPGGVAMTYQELRKQVGLPITNFGALPPLQVMSSQLSVAA